jgi:hypothetical protein
VGHAAARQAGEQMDNRRQPPHFCVVVTPHTAHTFGSDGARNGASRAQGQGPWLRGIVKTFKSLVTEPRVTGGGK